MVLVRSPGAIEAVERVTLTLRPERRTMLMTRVRLPGGDQLAAVSMHLSVPETGRSAGEVVRAAELAVRFAGDLPLLLGGDLNLRAAEVPGAFEELRRRFGLAGPTAPRAIDHLLVRGLDVVSAPAARAPAQRELRQPDGLALRLSDHAPVMAALRMR
jgi:endonuclease/exonuclease/phosphatase family metal-dependent hydrolase